MPFRRLTSVGFNWALHKMPKGQYVKYNLFMTKNGLKVRKIHKKMNRNERFPRVYFNFFSKISRKHIVKIKPSIETKVLVRQPKMKKNEECSFLQGFQRLSLQSEISSTKKRKIEDGKAGANDEFEGSKRFKSK